jgi:hypothetical protein
MKRFLCSKHSHHIKDKPIQLSTEKCSICRWGNRPWTLKDLAIELENVSAAMRFAHDDEYYDPFGYTYVQPLQDVVKAFINMMHPDYRKNFLEELNK